MFSLFLHIDSNKLAISLNFNKIIQSKPIEEEEEDDGDDDGVNELKTDTQLLQIYTHAHFL